MAAVRNQNQMYDAREREAEWDDETDLSMGANGEDPLLFEVALTNKLISIQQTLASEWWTTRPR
jgi:hypothetical protein